MDPQTPTQVVAYEPRVYFDEVPLDASGADVCNARGTLHNSERFCVRLTHLTASLRYLDSAGAVENELGLGRVAIALVMRDGYYMDRGVQPLVGWQNVATAAGRSVTAGLSSWRFQHPVRLPPCAALRMDVQLEQAGAAAVPVSVGFVAVGHATGCVQFLSQELLLTSTAPTPTDPAFFTNPLQEPLSLCAFTVNVHADVSQADPLGDVRRARVRLPWVHGPFATAPFVPASLLGLTTGRALVHRFPGAGLLWAPGEGCTLIARALTAGFAPTLHIGLLGHLLIT